MRLVAQKAEEYPEAVLSGLCLRMYMDGMQDKDVNSISMDELHGIFIGYEMRTKQENPDVKEATFKASKRSKQNGKQQEK
jgi:hypothetical protein